MTLVRNNDTATRTWGGLVDNGTQRTLRLRAGQMADVDLPEDFSDPYLAPVAPLEPPEPSPVPDTPPTPPEAPEIPIEAPETPIETEAPPAADQPSTDAEV